MIPVTSTANAAVRSAKKLTRRRGRDAGDAFLVEGPAVLDGMAYLDQVFVTRDAVAWIGKPAHQHDVEVVVVTDNVLRSLADTVTSRGVVGVARMPRASLDTVMGVVSSADGPRLLVADGIADPGNAGTLVRTADAAGFDAVVMTRGSVDPRNPKAVRATAGSIFHLPVADGIEPLELVSACRGAGVRMVGADANASRAYTTAPLSRDVAVVVGNEAHGLSPGLAGMLDDTVAIPMHSRPRPGYSGSAESLNLAISAAILMYESFRQRRRWNREPSLCENGL